MGSDQRWNLGARSDESYCECCHKVTIRERQGGEAGREDHQVIGSGPAATRIIGGRLMCSIAHGGQLTRGKLKVLTRCADATNGNFHTGSYELHCLS
jgi:hypothetical protein